MVAKIISATECRVGTNIIFEGDTYCIRKIDISKTGKHGHAKARIEAIGIMNNAKRKVFVIPGHDKLEVPTVDKRKGQVLSKTSESVSLMDLETFETIEIESKDEDLLNSLEENGNAEFWDVEGEHLLKRKL